MPNRYDMLIFAVGGMFIGLMMFISIKFWADAPVEVYEPTAPMSATVTVDEQSTGEGDFG